jgi:FRG domain-containing protein
MVCSGTLRGENNSSFNRNGVAEDGPQTQMRGISPSLTKELTSHCGRKPIWRAAPFAVSTYKALVEHVARLAYANRDELLFFRGQGKDFQSRAGGTTLYPTIYRGDILPTRELRHRFELLDQAARLLVEKFKKAKIVGYRELRQKRYIQWSILQHYEVVATPLLDLTHSLRVACSFAQQRSSDPTCYVYVLGLPYLTNRISINSEHDIVNVRLLSICPPAALRPYFQEGYVAGTADATSDFDSKTELDFRNRLIAKFAIPRAQNFWGTGFDRIPDSALYPRSDHISDLCENLRSEIRDELKPGDLGDFIKEWAAIEDYLLETGRRLTERNLTIREAIGALAKRNILTPETAQKLEGLRSFRNFVVHEPEDVNPTDLRNWLDRLRALAQSTIQKRE